MHTSLQITALTALIWLSAGLAQTAKAETVHKNYRIVCSGAPSGPTYYSYGQVNLTGEVHASYNDALGPRYQRRGTVEVKIDQLSLYYPGTHALMFEARNTTGSGPWSWGRSAYGWGQTTDVTLKFGQVDLDTFGLNGRGKQKFDVHLMGIGTNGETSAWVKFWISDPLTILDFLGDCRLTPM